MMSRPMSHLAWRPSPRFPRASAVTLVIAAAAMAVLGAPQWQLNRSIPAAPMPPAVDFAKMLSRLGAVEHPANWPLAWSRVVAPVSEHGRAIRIGLSSADLARAASSRNGWATWGAYYRTDPVAVSNSSLYSALVGVYTTDLIALIGRTGDGAFAASELQVVREQSMNGATFSTELLLARRLVRQLDPMYVTLGEWLEVARVAAAADDVDYFKEPSVRAFAVWAPLAPGLTGESRHALLRVRQLLPRQEPLDPAFRDALMNAIRLLAR